MLNNEICCDFTHMIVTYDTFMWDFIGGWVMADLTKEYTDVKDIKHKVEHFTVPTDDRNNTEQIMEELLHVLTRRPGKRIIA